MQIGLLRSHTLWRSSSFIWERLCIILHHNFAVPLSEQWLLFMSLKTPPLLSSWIPLPALGVAHTPLGFDGLIHLVKVFQITSPEVGREILWLSSVLLLCFNNMPSRPGTAIKIQSFLKETNLPLPQASFTTTPCHWNLNVKTMPSLLFHFRGQNHLLQRDN